MDKKGHAGRYAILAAAIIMAVLFLSILSAIEWRESHVKKEDAMCIGVVRAASEREVSKEEVLPPNTANFLAGRWHPAPECVQCHVSLLTTSDLRAKLGSCNCHDREYSTGGSIDMQKIRDKAHGIKVCIDCHIGTGLVDPKNISCDKFHRAHQNARCEACHLKEGSSEPFVPESDKCDACHGRDPHMAHGNKTTELCVVCHGDFGKKYKEAGVMPPEIGGAENKTAESAAPFPTISEIFENLLNELTGYLKPPI